MKVNFCVSVHEVKATEFLARTLWWRLQYASQSQSLSRRRVTITWNLSSSHANTRTHIYMQLYTCERMYGWMKAGLVGRMDGWMAGCMASQMWFDNQICCRCHVIKNEKRENVMEILL